MRYWPLFLLLASPSWAIRLFSIGFENQSAVALHEWTTVTGTAMSIDTSIKRSGAASLKVTGAVTTGYLTHTPVSSAARDIYLSMWIYIPTGGGTDTTTTILMFQTYPYIRLTSGRTLECWDSGAQEGSASSAIPLDEWHQIKLRYNDPGANNDIECYLDSTMFASGSGADLNGGNAFKVGPQNNFTGTLYFDDAIFNDATGATDTGMPTTNKIIHLLPTGAGDVTQSISLGGSSPAATAWESVDEIDPDMYVTIASMTATTAGMDFQMTNSADVGIGSEDTINMVAVGLVSHVASAASATHNTGLKTQTNGTVSSGTLTTIAVVAFNPHDDTAAARTYKNQVYVDPQASGAWTTSLLDSLQVRVFTSDVTPIVGITKVWALVDYIDNAAGGSTPPWVRRRVIVTQ